MFLRLPATQEDTVLFTVVTIQCPHDVIFGTTTSLISSAQPYPQNVYISYLTIQGDVSNGSENFTKIQKRTRTKRSSVLQIMSRGIQLSTINYDHRL